MYHTNECIAGTAKSDQSRLAWFQQWPYYCTNCNGDGMFVDYYDPSPPGISLGSGYMTDIEMCEKCTNHGYCPRCGVLSWPIDDEDDEIPETPCPNCGWNWCKGKDDSVPYPYECYCYELDHYWEERKYIESSLTELLM